MKCYVWRELLPTNMPFPEVKVGLPPETATLFSLLLAVLGLAAVD